MNSILRSIYKSFHPVKITKRGTEINFPCPICSHPSFSFNLHKRVGQCFRAKCSWRPRLRDLQPYLKGPTVPSEDLWELDPVPDQGPEKISLPEGAQRLVYLESGEMYTDRFRIVEEIQKRGVSIQDQYRFNFHADDSRIYIPVYEKGELVSYVGRLFWWVPFFSGLRYTYPEGSNIGRYFFNWDICSTWKTLTLVENTFNGIWLQKYNVTSNFGSNISEIQIEKILKSKAESVVILWDEGAEIKADKAVKALKSFGVPASYIKIKGQPDDHGEKEISEWIQRARSIQNKGNYLNVL